MHSYVISQIGVLVSEFGRGCGSRGFHFYFFLVSGFYLLCEMKIEELDDNGCSRDEEKGEMQIVMVDSKRALVGAVARILFYPTLLYNVLRNKIEAEFRWWDQVDEVFLSLHLHSCWF